MAELVRKTGTVAVASPAEGHPNRGMRCYMVQVTTGGAETSGTVNLVTDFGALSSTGAAATWFTAPVGITIQQDNGTIVANASVTAAGLVTTGTIVAAKDYWVYAFGM